MLAEPNNHPRSVRETAVELLFEKFQTPALFLAKNAVLSSFASGRQTSLVIDMGYESSVGKIFTTISHSHCQTEDLPLVPHNALSGASRITELPYRDLLSYKQSLYVITYIVPFPKKGYQGKLTSATCSLCRP